jgi:hypothetical protein
MALTLLHTGVRPSGLRASHTPAVLTEKVPHPPHDSVRALSAPTAGQISSSFQESVGSQQHQREQHLLIETRVATDGL